MRATTYQAHMYSLVKRAIDEIGPRPSCSEQEKKLGRLLVQEWTPICDEIRVEGFTCSPSAFLGSIPLASVFYILAVVLYWFVPPAALALAIIGAGVVLLELRYHEFVDFLFPRRHGENVIGVVRPRGKATKRVVVSAHLDSAYEFNLFYYLKNATLLVFGAAAVAALIVFGGSIAKTLAYYGGYSDERAFAIVGIIASAMTPVFGSLLFFHSYRTVPGAMDNMAGIAVLDGLARALDDGRRSGSWVAENAEVVLLATSSEEAGLRGAKRYVSRHLKEMKSLPTYGLFLDGICDERYLTVADREFFTGARHNPELIQMARDAAQSRGWPISVKSIPVGASDASAFSLKGVPSVCLLCQDISRLVPNYHTRSDTYEHVRPESLAVTLQVVIDMIGRLDGEHQCSTMS